MSKRIRTAKAWGILDEAKRLIAFASNNRFESRFTIWRPRKRVRIVLESDWRLLMAELKRLRAGKGTGC